MRSATDPFDLRRFVDAQARVYHTVVEELRAGRKRSVLKLLFITFRGR
jgi:uncharacterized protein (DUF1810 family)